MPRLRCVDRVGTALLAIGVMDVGGSQQFAVRAARAACSADGLLLLDDTVAIAHLKPVRDDDGHVKLQRAYGFEYSDTGNNRLQGSIVLLGHRVTLLNVGLRLPPEVRTLH